MNEKKCLVVIGGQIAGMSAALFARYEYPDAQITVVAAENVALYNKIALVSYLTGKKMSRHLRFYPDNWLESERIALVLGKSAVALDREGHTVALSDGRVLPYDKLILATGAEPIELPMSDAEQGLWMPLWSLSDAAKIHAALPTSERVVVVGGGILGVETAVDLANYGKVVTLVEGSATLMATHLDKEAAGMFARFMEQKRIDLKLGSFVDSVQSSGSFKKLLLEDGSTLETDLVILTAGVRPNVVLAREAGLQVNRGIVVDSHMVTSDPDILACGNCTELDGGLRLLWNPAKHEGEVAGRNAFVPLLQAHGSPEIVHVKLPEMPLFVCGTPLHEQDDDRVLVRKTDECYRLLRLSESGQVKGAILLGDASGYYSLQKAAFAGWQAPKSSQNGGDLEEMLRLMAQEFGEDEGETKCWVCQMCGYVYEGEYPPEICPVCAVGKDQFLVA